jgi:homopolymeric O-antigen transport system permease protein
MSIDSGSLIRSGAARTVRRPVRRFLSRPRSLWAAREILYVIITREIKLRYASTALGAFWTVAQPLLMLAVFSYAFSRFHRSGSGVPYAVWAICGLALWLFIARALTSASGSVRGNLPLVQRTACPRLFLPLGSVCASTVDLLVTGVMFLIMAAGFYGIFPTWRFALAPVVLAFAFALVLGLSFFLSALEVRSRDVPRALPYLVQFWFFASPVAYQLPVHPGVTQLLHTINPAVGLLGLWRWSLVGDPFPSSQELLVLLAWTVGALVVGFVYFTRFERVLADDL